MYFNLVALIQGLFSLIVVAHIFEDLPLRHRVPKKLKSRTLNLIRFLSMKVYFSAKDSIKYKIICIYQVSQIEKKIWYKRLFNNKFFFLYSFTITLNGWTQQWGRYHVHVDWNLPPYYEDKEYAN